VAAIPWWITPANVGIVLAVIGAPGHNVYVKCNAHRPGRESRGEAVQEEQAADPSITGWEAWTSADGGHTFAHPSERFVSRVLDLCRLRWEYEPRTFVLRWAQDGGIAEGFTPDFFVAEVDLYLEVTTLRQDLTTRKHRKIRRTRELYPGTQVHILHRHDCELLRSMVTRGRILRHHVRRTLEVLLGGPAPLELIARGSYHTCVERVIDANGFIQLHGQALYAHSGLAQQSVRVWIYTEWLEIEHAGRVVARYRCLYDPAARRVHRPSHPRHYTAGLPRQRRLPSLPARRAVARPARRPAVARRPRRGPAAHQLSLGFD
jgi:hypoxanthine phosphoribosyltransferase